jgi:hypothetical protein
MATPTTETQTRTEGSVGWRWTLFVVSATISVLTMPLTAIWFSLLGPLVAIVSCAIALVPRSDARRTRIVLTGGAIAGGLWVGPAVYLGLALLRPLG